MSDKSHTPLLVAARLAGRTGRASLTQQRRHAASACLQPGGYGARRRRSSPDMKSSHPFEYSPSSRLARSGRPGSRISRTSQSRSDSSLNASTGKSGSRPSPVSCSMRRSTPRQGRASPTASVSPHDASGVRVCEKAPKNSDLSHTHPVATLTVRGRQRARRMEGRVEHSALWAAGGTANAANEGVGCRLTPPMTRGARHREPSALPQRDRTRCTRSSPAEVQPRNTTLQCLARRDARGCVLSSLR